MFELHEESPLLIQSEKENFHSVVAKLLYIAKRGRPDILTAVNFLTSRVLRSNQEDAKKLKRICDYLNTTSGYKLKLECNLKVPTIECWIDASFAVHKDRKSVTGVAIMIGNACVYASSVKQKIVTKSSTEAELVAASDGLSYGLWVRNFMQYLGYTALPIKLMQDNKSAIIMAEKGWSSAG
jgi:hypothetical protein